MAQPTQPIEIWAQQNVVLPVSHQTNKVRPIDDLWAKGYDKGQKPANEEWNYLWNMTTLWLSYITGEQIPGLDNRYLRRSLNLSDLANVATARTNLGVYSKTETDAKYVQKSGDTMTGILRLPRLDFAAASSDLAYITCTNPAADWTYLDFMLGDNPGTPGTAGVDVMRWRFSPSGGTAFSMMELNAINSTTGYLRVLGNIQARQIASTGALSWTGAGTGNTLALTGSVLATAATFSSLNVTANNAVVGGKNIVRSVNGVSANAAGDVTISAGVQDVRWSALGTNPNSSFVNYDNGRKTNVPAGAVIVNMADYTTGKSWIEDVDIVWYRYLQKQVSGTWYNVGAL